ncbi:hypothetical protein K504DRAFT_464688 [Pleomassaria siparia CBS 279.74]|uniref:Uncharacterized protein n=1 Tax=Pleomassaria siparia CBS 279.74 TaxID=1314801 RepID=A0A6G1KJS6_9PLEO|nr:hypothetical protein K504DRAFT_464688 [Pleomassaria siparia CBS 279.74]
MDDSTLRPRQTTILDDSQALAIGDATQKRRARLSSIAKSGKSKASTPTPTPGANPRFYEQDGLKIPLYAGKTKRTARETMTIYNKGKRPDLLTTIKEYAGQAKHDEMVAAGKSNKELAQWISEMEAIALPMSGRKKNKMAKEQKDDGGLEEKMLAAFASDDRPGPEPRSKPKPGPESKVTMEIAQPSGQQRISRTQVMAGSPTPEVLLTSLPVNQNQPITLTGDFVTKSQADSPVTSRKHSTKRTREVADLDDDDEPKSEASRPMKKIKEVLDEAGPMLHVTRYGKRSFQKGGISPPRSYNPEDYKVQACVYVTAQVDKSNMTHHPYIDELKLTADTRTRIYDDPLLKQTTVVTMISETEVEDDTIVWPYLRAGKHGYDYENNKWSWEGHDSLSTGYGHQIEPEDQKRMDKDPSFKNEFDKKYPGILCNQWPCGCQMPWNDSDSEAD